jgi:hypothetical protein
LVVFSATELSTKSHRVCGGQKKKKKKKKRGRKRRKEKERMGRDQLDGVIQLQRNSTI